MGIDIKVMYLLKSKSFMIYIIIVISLFWNKNIATEKRLNNRELKVWNRIIFLLTIFKKKKSKFPAILKLPLNIISKYANNQCYECNLNMVIVCKWSFVNIQMILYVIYCEHSHDKFDNGSTTI